MTKLSFRKQSNCDCKHVLFTLTIKCLLSCYYYTVNSNGYVYMIF